MPLENFSFWQRNPIGIARKRQLPTEIVDVSNWEKQDDPHGKGARSKTKFIAPQDGLYDFIIPNHTYQFKYYLPADRKRAQWQFWNEVIACTVGRHIGFSIPPAFLAVLKEPDDTIRYGCISEWCYGYPNLSAPNVDIVEQTLPGSDLLVSIIPEYDYEKGRQHNIQDIIHIFRNTGGRSLIRGWSEQWADLLLFDALIGNSDRHQDNWEMLFHFEGEATAMCCLAPIYDNGTSLGNELIEDIHIEKKAKNLDAYWDKSMSHISRTLDDAISSTRNFKHSCHHKEVITYFLKLFPVCREHMQQRLQFSIEPLRKEIALLEDFAIEPKFTSTRGDFIIHLLEHRQKQLTLLLDA